MRLNGNGTGLRLVLGTGERLEGQVTRLRRLSATSDKSFGSGDKPSDASRYPGVLSRSLIG
jgi:hypothetical protein